MICAGVGFGSRTETRLSSALYFPYQLFTLLWLHGWEQENWLHSQWVLPTSANQTVNWITEGMCGGGLALYPGPGYEARGGYVTTMCSAGLSNCVINRQCIFKPWTSNLAPLARLPLNGVWQSKKTCKAMLKPKEGNCLCA